MTNENEVLSSSSTDSPNFLPFEKFGVISMEALAIVDDLQSQQRRSFAEIVQGQRGSVQDVDGLGPRALSHKTVSFGGELPGSCNSDILVFVADVLMMSPLQPTQVHMQGIYGERWVADVRSNAPERDVEGCPSHEQCTIAVFPEDDGTRSLGSTDSGKFPLVRCRRGIEDDKRCMFIFHGTDDILLAIYEFCIEPETPYLRFPDGRHLEFGFQEPIAFIENHPRSMSIVDNRLAPVATVKPHLDTQVEVTIHIGVGPDEQRWLFLVLFCGILATKLDAIEEQ